MNTQYSHFARKCSDGTIADLFCSQSGGAFDYKLYMVECTIDGFKYTFKRGDEGGAAPVSSILDNKHQSGLPADEFQQALRNWIKKYKFAAVTKEVVQS